MNRLPSILRTVGSLWFAAVLLILLLVAMACATVFESMHGTERTLATFYRSWWFEVLLALVCVNAGAAVILRYPFSKKQIGFALTHLAILVILVGALLSASFGVDGQIGIVEGQTVRHFNDVRQETLTVVNHVDQTQASIDLDAPVFGGFDAVDDPATPDLVLGDARVNVQRYLPDSVWAQRVLDDDDPGLPSAVEVSLSPSGQENPTWVFAEHGAAQATASVVYRVIPDAAELARLVSRQATSRPGSAGLVKATCGEATLEIPVERCADEPVPLGDSGYTIRVLRYLPHAIVGTNNRLSNASDRPINPAIEVEITGPAAAETRFAFAKFPRFKHRPHKLAEVELTFVAAEDPTPIAPLEILGVPGGELYVRFSAPGAPVATHKLSLGSPVDSPWPGWKFAVLRRFEHAREEWLLEPSDSIRADRAPALLLKISTPTDTRGTWIQKYEPRRVVVGGMPYDLIYGNKQVPLGFALTLNRFQIGTYPGETMPRSFESQITTLDPITGREQSHVISMNNPAKHGGYTLYQSSYKQPPDGPAISFLSVARDPGKPVVFAGYIALMTGTLVVLGTRVAERRQKVRAVVPTAMRGVKGVPATVAPTAGWADAAGKTPTGQERV
jgi:hypothetical protein